MGRVVVGFLAAAAVFAGWRNLPRIDQPSAGAAGLLLGGAILAAFLLGRRSVKAEAIATAAASARAEAAAAAHAGAQSVSSVVLNIGAQPAPGGARAVAEQLYGQPAWIGPARADAVQLEGSDALLSMADELGLSGPQDVPQGSGGQTSS